MNHPRRRPPLPLRPLPADNASLMSQAPSNEGPAPVKDGGAGGKDKSIIPEGLWMRCPDCGEMLFRKVVEEALHVCPNGDYHFRISAPTRIEQLVDPGRFEEMFEDVEPADPLKFTDKKAYKDQLVAEQAKTGRRDAVMCGKGFIKGRPLMLAVMDPEFMMGSMGSVVGEKITRTVEAAADEKQPLRNVSCSRRARMQEPTRSRMQMAKTSDAPHQR